MTILCFSVCVVTYAALFDDSLLNAWIYIFYYIYGGDYVLYDEKNPHFEAVHSSFSIHYVL
jgi:hypothetical protein